MKYVFQFSLQDYKQKSIVFLLLLNAFPNLYPVRSFHWPGLKNPTCADFYYTCILLSIYLYNSATFRDTFVLHIKQCKICEILCQYLNLFLSCEEKSAFFLGVRHFAFIIKQEDCDPSFLCEYASYRSSLSSPPKLVHKASESSCIWECSLAQLNFFCGNLLLTCICILDH